MKLNPELMPKILPILKDKLNEDMKPARKDMIDRDAHVMFIDDTIKNFNIDEIAGLTSSNEREYSPPAIWAIFEDIPNFLKNENIFTEDKLKSLENENIPMHLYELYVSKRLKNDDDKLDDDNKEEIKRVFLDLLKLLKNSNLLTAVDNILTDQPIEDDDELMVLEPTLRIKNDLIHVIREYLRLKNDVPYSLDELLNDIDLTSNNDAKL